MYKVEVIKQFEIIEDFASGYIRYQTWDDSKPKNLFCSNKFTKKGYTTIQIDGFKIKIDITRNEIVEVKDVSTIRNGTAKICEYMKRITEV